MRGTISSSKPAERARAIGPNGSGKSTLAHVLAAAGYEVTAGRVLTTGRTCSPCRRRHGAARVSSWHSSTRSKSRCEQHLLPARLLSTPASIALEELEAWTSSSCCARSSSSSTLDQDLLNRPVNAGFSGGEKKRNEIFQMAVLEPRLAILDETDSLDIDALRRRRWRQCVAQPRARHPAGDALPALAELHRAGSRHVLQAGRIVKSGDKSLALSKPRLHSASGRRGRAQRHGCGGSAARTGESRRCRRPMPSPRCAIAARRASPTSNACECTPAWFGRGDDGVRPLHDA